MIKRAERENIDEIKRLWKVCFPDVDERYQDFFFKNVVRLEDCYIKVLEGKIVATLVRNKHALMFNSRVLQAIILACSTRELNINACLLRTNVATIFPSKTLI